VGCWFALRASEYAGEDILLHINGILPQKNCLCLCVADVDLEKGIITFLPPWARVGFFGIYLAGLGEPVKVPVQIRDPNFSLGVGVHTSPS